MLYCALEYGSMQCILRKNKKTINLRNYLKLLNGVSNAEIRYITFVIENWVHPEIHFVYEHSNVSSLSSLKSVYVCMCVCVCMYVCICTGLFFWQVNISITLGPIFFTVVCPIGKKKNFTVVIVYDLNE